MLILEALIEPEGRANVSNPCDIGHSAVPTPRAAMADLLAWPVSPLAQARNCYGAGRAPYLVLLRTYAERSRITT